MTELLREAEQSAPFSSLNYYGSRTPSNSYQAVNALRQRGASEHAEHRTSS